MTLWTYIQHKIYLLLWDPLKPLKPQPGIITARQPSIFRPPNRPPKLLHHLAQYPHLILRSHTTPPAQTEMKPHHARVEEPNLIPEPLDARPTILQTMHQLAQTRDGRFGQREVAREESRAGEVAAHEEMVRAVDGVFPPGFTLFLERERGRDRAEAIAHVTALFGAAGGDDVGKRCGGMDLTECVGETGELEVEGCGEGGRVGSGGGRKGESLY